MNNTTVVVLSPTGKTKGGGSSLLSHMLAMPLKCRMKGQGSHELVEELKKKLRKKIDN